MSNKTWKTQELLNFCPQPVTDEASVYVKSVGSKIDRILFLKDRLTASEDLTLKRGSSEFSKTQLEVEIYVESIASNLHSLADVLAQIINVIVLKPLLSDTQHFSSDEVSLYKVKTKLAKLNLDYLKRMYADEIVNTVDTLYNSMGFSYISGFVNTIKHRRFLNTTFHLKINSENLIDLGFKLDAFNYDKNHFPEKLCRDIVIDYGEEIINLVFDIGNSINKYCRAVFIMQGGRV